MSVYKAINLVQADLCRLGIGKDSTNTFDNYKFRGIDAVYNALSPLLAKHGLCILPRMLSRTSEERVSQKGGALFYVTVDVEFDFVSAEDGSRHTVKTYGEAMDRGDKGTNKAMSAAYKYACFQTFCIPTEAQDADAESHEVASRVDKLREIADYLKDGINRDDPSAVIEVWADLPEDDKKALWVAESKGGYFSQSQKQYIRTAMDTLRPRTESEAA